MTGAGAPSHSLACAGYSFGKHNYHECVVHDVSGRSSDTRLAMHACAISGAAYAGSCATRIQTHSTPINVVYVDVCISSREWSYVATFALDVHMSDAERIAAPRGDSLCACIIVVALMLYTMVMH